MITVNVHGVEGLVRHIESFRQTLPEKLRTLCEKLSEMGVSFMSAGFRTAFYDGTIDAVVGNPEWVTEHTLEIPVTGSTVAFIEFGTGIHYADTHPEAARLGAIRGGYGKGRGRNDTWKYYGDPGSLGWYYDANDQTRGLVTTHGNPANSVMYNAAKQMRMKITETARSVFVNG